MSAGEDNRIPVAVPSQWLGGIDLEPVVGQHLYTVILILKIDSAVIILKRPHKGKAVRTCLVTSSVLAENDQIILFITGNGRIERIEDAIII